MKAASEILTQYEMKGYLTDKERKRMIRVMADYCVEHFGEKPSKYQKIALAKAIISVFPFLRIENSRCGGIVSFFLRISVLISIVLNQSISKSLITNLYN